MIDYITHISKLNSILEQMLVSANDDDEKMVLALNESFGDWYKPVSEKMPADLASKYEDCRQALVIAFNSEEERKKLIEEATKRFNIILDYRFPPEHSSGCCRQHSH